MAMRVAIVGGTGKTGRAVRAALEHRGAEAVALGRENWPDLGTVLAASDAIHIIAPNMYREEPALVRHVLDAARTAGVERVVYHSVAAPYAPTMPHHAGKAMAEDIVRRSATAWTILEPCAYIQNFVPALRTGTSLLEVPYSVHRSFGLVDLNDVAEATAAVLLSDAHVGSTYELGGPAMVTIHDIALAASRVLGRPIEARRVNPEDWAERAASDLRFGEIEWLLAMFRYYDEYGLPTGRLSLETLLGRPATSVERVLARELAERAKDSGDLGEASTP